MRNFLHFTKYNCVLADTGVASSGLVIFFCILYPGFDFPSWWGNTVYEKTADAAGTPWKQLPDCSATQLLRKRLSIPAPAGTLKKIVNVEGTTLVLLDILNIVI